MNKISATALGLVAGFIGGAISHCLFVLTPVRAQAPMPPPLEIRAQKFVLAGENGAVQGVFGLQKDGTPELQIRSGTGNDILRPRWIGINLRRNVLPDLSLSEPPKSSPPGSPK